MRDNRLHVLPQRMELCNTSLPTHYAVSYLTDSRHRRTSSASSPNVIPNKALLVLNPLHRGKATQNVSEGRNGFQYNYFTIRGHATTRKIITEKCSSGEVGFCSDREMVHCVPFQTLKTFPSNELHGKVIMVRFDSRLCPRDDQFGIQYPNKNAINTLKYLCNAGAKVVVVTHSVSLKNSSKDQYTQLVADYLSVCLEKKVVAAEGVTGHKVECSISKLENGDILLLGNLSLYREEAANCMDFARNLSAKIDILVNDSFSESHRVLASTVGVARFTYARIAGFHLTEVLSLFAETLQKPKHPFIVIMGGAKILEKRDALHSLLHICDKLVFVGSMAFTFLSALGLSVSPRLVEKHALGEAMQLLDIAKAKGVEVLLPKDFWCSNDAQSCQEVQVCKVQCVMDGWRPYDIGPETLNEIASFLSESKTSLWIGPVKLGTSKHRYHGSMHLARLLGRISENGCTTVVLGKEACNFVREASAYCSAHLVYEHGAAVWELLKGRTLAGVAALDRVCTRNLDWRAIFRDPCQPLFVDVGSGNGLFILKMAQLYEHLNFLGLEINKKLVHRSLACIQEMELMNAYFVSTDASSSFHSIIASYPGVLWSVSIQCPDPNFSDPEHRWRMLQRLLVKAIIENIYLGGKIFLQSDVKEVALRMKNQFLQYGEGKVVMSIEHNDNQQCNAEGWLKDNPYGVFSDWEQHAIDRGKPMYRVMLSKASML